MTDDVPALKICSNGCTHASYHPNPTFPMRLQQNDFAFATPKRRRCSSTPPTAVMQNFGTPRDGNQGWWAGLFHLLRVRQAWLLVSRHQTSAYTDSDDMIYQLKYCCITAGFWIRMNRVSGYLHLQQAPFDSLLQASVQLIRCFSLRSLWRTKWTSCHLAWTFVGATRPTLGLQQFKTIWPFGNVRVCQTPADWEIHQLSGSWICIISVLQRNTGNTETAEQQVLQTAAPRRALKHPHIVEYLGQLGLNSTFHRCFPLIASGSMILVDVLQLLWWLTTF